MTKFPVLFAMVTLTFGVAQASTIYTNTFDLGQVFIGGPGPAAPAAATNFSGADTLDALGVTFSFTEGPSLAAATYGDTIGTAGLGLSPLSDPVLDGPSDGTLTLNFAYPTDFVSFDIVLFEFSGASTGGTVTIGATQDTFSAAGGQGSGGDFAIGSFSSVGTTSAPFSTAVITFADPTTEFAMDNLSFDTPEPASLSLLVAGTLLLGVLLRLRRSPLRASNRA